MDLCKIICKITNHKWVCVTSAFYYVCERCGVTVDFALLWDEAHDTDFVFPTNKLLDDIAKRYEKEKSS